MAKDIGVVIALPAELKHRVDAMAAGVGLTAQTLMLAWVLQGLRGPSAAPFVSFQGTPEHRGGTTIIAEVPIEEDAWRGDPNADEPDQPSGVDVEAMVASRMAEAESDGAAAPAQQPYEAFGPPTAAVAPANVRSLRRPPPQFAPANQPSHLRSL